MPNCAIIWRGLREGADALVGVQKHCTGRSGCLRVRGTPANSTEKSFQTTAKPSVNAYPL